MFQRLDEWSTQSALDAVRGAKYATLTGDVDLSYDESNKHLNKMWLAAKPSLRSTWLKSK